MRTANKQNQVPNPINEKKNNKVNVKNFSKSPLRQKHSNNNNYTNQNQYAMIEQAKKDFQRIERGNYSSNKMTYERNFSKDNYNSKNSKHSDYDISKEEAENRPLAVNHINAYVSKKIENNSTSNNSKEKIQNYSNKLPMRHTNFTAGNINCIQNPGTNDSNKEKHTSIPRMQNNIQQIRNKRNTGGYVNNIGIKTKEYFANEVDIEIKNFQANTGKNISSSLTYNLNPNLICESKNKQNEKEGNLNNLVRNVNSNNNIPNSNGIKYNTNSTKNKQVINRIDSTYVFSENINHKNFNNVNKAEEKLSYSKVNFNIPNDTNVNYNNLYDFKDSNLKSNSEGDKNKELNTKIKLLVDKIKEKKSYEGESHNQETNSKKPRNLQTNEESNQYNNYDFPLQISPSIRSKEISSVIADLQTKNEQLSNQLSSFREKFIEPDYQKNEASNNRNQKNKSKSSKKSLGIIPVSHDKKKSFDNASNKSGSRNASLVRNTNNNYNNTNINFNKNAYFESSEKKNSNEKNKNFLSLQYQKTASNFNKNSGKNNTNNNNLSENEYFNYLKDEANYHKKESFNNNNIIGESESQSEANSKSKIKSNSKFNAIQNNFIYESMKIRNTKYLNEEGNLNKNKSFNNNLEETEKINSIKNINTNPEVLLSWNAAFAGAVGVPKSPLRRLQDKVSEKEIEITAMELKLKQANMSAIANEKNACKAERKVESLQKIISEILSKNKADQGTIEKLREEVGKLGRDGDSIYNTNNNNANKLFKNFSNEEFIVHKIYSNFNEVQNENPKSKEKQNNSFQNSFYFVLISDAAQEYFLWVDLTNLSKTLNSNVNCNQSHSRNIAHLNCDIGENHNQELIQLYEAINHFNVLARKYKNSINTEEVKDKQSNKNNKIMLSPAKINKKYPDPIEKLSNLSLLKHEKFKNFTAVSLPLQNLYTIEAEIISVHADYLSLDREFSKSKKFLVDEITAKDFIIGTLRVDLEKLIDDNGNIYQSANTLKNELAEKENKLINLDLLNKEKDSLIAELRKEFDEIKEKFEKCFENRKALETRITELQGIVIEKSEIEKKVVKEKENLEVQIGQVSLKLEEASKLLSEKDLVIERFSCKLDELEAKYKDSFAKVEFVEKNELLASVEINKSIKNKNDSYDNGTTNLNLNSSNNNNNNNNSNNNNNNYIGNDERICLLGKMHELDLQKNSYLDKINILEYINKNFENEKADKEKQIDELSFRLTEMQNNLETLATENTSHLAKIADKESQIENSLADLSTFKAKTEKEIESLKKLNEELELKLKENLEEKTSLTNTLAIRSSNASNSEKENKELKKELKEIKSIADEKALNLAASVKKINDLESQIRFNFEKFDEEKTALRDEMNFKLTNLLTEKSEILVKYQALLEEFNKYQQNCEKLKKQNEENLIKVKAENKKLKIKLSELTNKNEIENKELEELLLEFNSQVENSAKMQRDFLEAESQLRKLDTVLIKQEETIGKLTSEKEQLMRIIAEEKNKNSNLLNNSKDLNKNNNQVCNFDNDGSKSNNVENSDYLNNRILELQKITIQLENDIKEKVSKIDSLETDRLLIGKKLSEAKETNEKNIALINEKNKKLIADDFTIKDLSRKLNDLEIDLKNTEDENLLFKTKLNEMQKNLNFLLEKENQVKKNTGNNNNKNAESQEKLIAELESEIKMLSEENLKLKEDLDNARNQCERLVDELNENNILKMDPNITKRGDEVNVTLYENNDNYKTNLNNSSHLNNSNSIFDLNNTNNCININSANALTNSTANNNYVNSNYNKKSNDSLLNSNRKENSDNINNNNEYMLKIIDYEDKLEKLIFSNSQLARKNNSLTIEIKKLQERIYALENFEEPEINKKLKQMRKKSQDYSSSMLNPQKDLVEMQIEKERLQELIKDYELSISELQNKLELQYNEINKLRDEYEDEIANLKKKEVDNFSFFANDKTDRNNTNNNYNQTFSNNNHNNFNNITFYDSNNNENDCRISNLRLSNEDYFKKLNGEIIEKNKLIEKLTKELNDSYALMGEADKKLEIFEVDYLNKSK